MINVLQPLVFFDGLKAYYSENTTIFYPYSGLKLDDIPKVYKELYHRNTPSYFELNISITDFLQRLITQISVEVIHGNL